ncbi:hypothetical protein H310_03813 [Aphanomyces invadans]|uniref:F5/8 type C domain-containing protein n=1 Tax=Aphanomyces invadans TaxID=157072 RepID=A0A024UG56_9STRA|nr:hypothetical protein H310_03813 [Aphanomyces invadans]ETW04618.1 hypothetical protein H310_03813 [Aphanomyces invadans]|eukprot:XP_008866056.1 hypothetical protein H310_03813 [Aphanomyces invadans]
MDLALDVEGAQVTSATSFDPKFPPSNVLDGETSTKWATCGLYPQEIIVQLATTSVISKVKTWTTNAKHVVVEVCAGPVPTKWEKVADTNLGENDGNLQIETQVVSRDDASFVKFKVLSGYHDFITVHRISVEGKAPRK